MSQSDIQSLIQNLAGTHTASQASVPGAANNGNPNTVYNSPSINAQGQQFSQGVGPAASVAGLTLPQQSYGTSQPAGLDQLLTSVLPNWGGNTGSGTWGGTVVNPTTPPTTTPPTTGGPLPPSTGTGYRPPNINTSIVGGTRGYNNGWINAPIPIYNSGGTGGTESGGYLRSPGLWGTSPGLASSLDLNANGTMDWQQLLDVLSEPFISGDLYNAQTNTWNAGNLAAGAGGLLGGPAGSLISLANDIFGGKFNPELTQNYLSNWLVENQSRMMNDIGDKSEQSITELANEISNKLSGPTTNRYGNTQAQINQALGRGQAVTSGGRIVGDLASGIRGGAGVISGDAARSFFESMRLAQMGEMQTGADHLGRAYDK